MVVVSPGHPDPAVGLEVGLPVLVLVPVGVRDGWGVGLRLDVGDGVPLRTAVGRGVPVAVRLADTVAVRVKVALNVGLAETVGVRLRVGVGLGVGEAVELIGGWTRKVTGFDVRLALRSRITR